ncbi:carbohydrate ABC transporter permease [soil metagenome]
MTALSLGAQRRTSPAWTRHLLLVPALLILLYPLAWLLSSSFKPEVEIFTNPGLLPITPTLENYVEGWTGAGQPFWLFIVNSLVISVLATVFTVISSAFAGYAFARLDFPFRRIAFAAMLVTIMLPAQVTLIPQYLIFRDLGWIDTFLPLIVPKLLATEGFFVFLFVQFIRGLPLELDEAARIDGCGPIRTFFQIIFPLLTPAIVTSAVFSFIWTFDDFFSQIIYLSTTDKYTVPMALRLFIDASGGQSSYGAMLAMAVVALIPVTIVFLVLQRRLTEGIATVGLKG